MEERNKKRYVQRQPPDKNQKPKYVQKKQFRESQQTKPRRNEYRKKQQKYNEKPQKREQKRQFRPKAPVFIEKQSSDTYDTLCLICSESMGKREPIWTCNQCFKYIHLRCMRQWIQNVNRQSMASADKKKFIYNWTCPMCKYQYNQNMPQYYCFCGRQKNPEFNRDLQPHSCGGICGRKRGPYCTHPCPIPCHSGKCPPCQNQGTLIDCNCGKTQRTVKCSQQRQVFQCGKKCDKILNCHKHKCQRNCHKGPCLPCSKKRLVKCHCSKNQDVVDCVEVSYACAESCDKQLNCGYHKCAQKCHEGQCFVCKRTPESQKTCPCGKNSLMLLTGDQNFRKSCKDSIPVCGMPCKKTLICEHLCPLSCHDSQCPPCKITIQQPCECALTSRKVQCYVSYSKKEEDRFRCDNICKKKKTCGQHVCYNVCCKFRNSKLPEDHKCELTCQKTLNCKKHTCGQSCHTGNCKKCPVVYSQPQQCPCGTTSLKPPIICGTFVPQCDNTCSKQLECGHKCLMKCHYGPCKCYQSIFVTCRCGKEEIQTTCGKEALCLNKCKQILECGHQCSLQCHANTCQEAHKGHPCKKNCDKKRESCDHLCTQSCHFGQKCQQFPCQVEILIKCQCGNRKTTVICGNLDKKHKKTILCNKKCENVKRFDALYKDKQIYYPTSIFQFGFKNFAYLEKLQYRLQKFISQSQQPFLEIQFKFANDNSARLQLISLFENHYHLNTHFYRYRQHASFTVMQTDDTMIPKPCLTEYIKLVAKGKIKRNNLPFQYTIKFECSQKDKAELWLKALLNYKHRYYVEKKQKYLVHFWDKNDGITGLELMKNANAGVQFLGQQNIVQKQPEDNIQEGQIVEFDVKEEQQNQSKPVAKDSKLDLIQQNSQNTTKTKESNEINKQKPSLNQQALDSLTKKQSKKEKPKIVFRNQPFFQKPEYPPAKDFVQQIYYLDQDQLYNEKIDWQNYVNELISKQIGPQASQWRLRTLLMINDIEAIGDEKLGKQFEKLIKMYAKDKQRAQRILELQKLQVKKIKAQMDINGIYLSNFQPQMMSYAKMFNFISEYKIEGIEQLINQDADILDTLEINKAIDAVQHVSTAAAQDFFKEFSSSDYMQALLLKQMIPELRQKVIESIKVKNNRPSANKLYEHLFFKTEAQMLMYFELYGGIILDKKQSKSKGCLVYFIKDNARKQQSVQLEKEKELLARQIKKNINELVRSKRDKKFFLSEPEQLVDDTLMLRSFFAFGDFKESVNPKYMNALCKKLKKQ